MVRFLRCQSGNLELVQYLIEIGFDVNTMDSGLKNGLMWGCSRGHLKIVEYMAEEICVDVATNVDDLDCSTNLEALSASHGCPKICDDIDLVMINKKNLQKLKLKLK